ncbi:MAG: GntR family transcriptional regulator [Paracoccaceae bacterium]|nr:GntR family transcriptional regulator [Paracoccaceae bacterium]
MADLIDSTPDRRQTMITALRRRILTMQLAPGAVLDEYALAEEFGLSRPPVRELMRQMAGEGYIELEPNRPARVAGMGYHSLRDFFLFAPLVYVASTRLAAERRTDADLEMLRDIQGEFRAAIAAGDVESRVFQNDRFHLAIGEVARNAYVLPSLRRCLIDHARIAKVFYEDHVNPKMTAERDEAAAQHDQIIDAIAARDADWAEALVRAHLDLSRRNIAMYATPETMNVHLEE